MRLSRLLVLPVVAAALAVPQAAAASTGTTSSNDGVLYDTCKNHRWSWSIDPDHAEWELDVELIAPDGTGSDSDWLWSGSDATSGTSTFLFCGWEQAGRYRIVATLTEYDEDFNEYTTRLPNSSFTMRDPRSRTGLRVSDRTPHYNEIVRFKASTTDERPAGFRRTPYATTKLQVRTPRGWVTLRGSRTLSNDRGVSTWRYRWNVKRTYKVRAITVRDSAYRASVSHAVKVDQVPNGRLVPSRTSIVPTVR
jgi:hypothetical protein